LIYKTVASTARKAYIAPYMELAYILYTTVRITNALKGTDRPD
jgi:hypothetical protein